MAGDWFADSEGDSDLGGRARNDTESHEVVDYAFGPSDSESESNTEKLKELLRDDSSKDVTFAGTANKEGGLPDVDLGVYSSVGGGAGKTTETGKGRPRVGRRAAKPGATDTAAPKLEELKRSPAQKPKVEAPASAAGTGFVNNALYVSPEKSSENLSPRAERSASSVTGEWSLDMDQLLPDSAPKPKLGRRQGQRPPKSGEHEGEATSKAAAASSDRRRSPQQEKLPALGKSASPAPKMTMTTGYQPSFMTRALEIEDSRSANDVSESIGLEYSEDFESSRSSLSPTRMGADAFGQEGTSRPSRLPLARTPRAAEPKVVAEDASSAQKKPAAAAVSPKPKPKAAASSSTTNKKAKRAGSPDKKRAQQGSVENAEAAGLRAKVASLEQEIENLRNQGEEIRREREEALRTNQQARAESMSAGRELEGLKASLAQAQQENARLARVFEEKSRAERDHLDHARTLEEKVVSLSEELREKDEIAKSISTFDGVRGARALLGGEDADPDVHPVISEFLEEIKSTLDDERLTLKREQDRIEKLMSSVNTERATASRQHAAVDAKEKEVARMEESLRAERQRMLAEVEEERSGIQGKIEGERRELRRQIERERESLKDQMSSDRRRLEGDREALERSIRQLRGEEELLKNRIRRLDDELASQGREVAAQKERAEKMRSEAEAARREVGAARQSLDADRAKVDGDLKRIDRLKEDVERQLRASHEDKVLVNSERQILSKISSEVSEKEAQLALRKEELSAQQASAEEALEKVARERVEIAYQIKLLTDERLKSSAAAREAREAEKDLRSKMRDPGHRRALRSRGNRHRAAQSGKENEKGLSYPLRMQLLMAELERERQTIAHDKRRNARFLETQERYIYQAKTDLMRSQSSALRGGMAWGGGARRGEERDGALGPEAPAEANLEASASFTAFTDLTAITSEDDH